MDQLATAGGNERQKACHPPARSTTYVSVCVCALPDFFWYTALKYVYVSNYSSLDSFSELSAVSGTCVHTA